MIMLLIMVAGLLGYAITIDHAPQQITKSVTTLTNGPAMILMLIVVLPVVSGMFLEGAATDAIRAHRSGTVARLSQI